MYDCHIDSGEVYRLLSNLARVLDGAIHLLLRDLKLSVWGMFVR
jgi:hypothetical protein